MRLISLRRSLFLPLLCVIQFVTAAPANASVIPLVNSQVLALVQAVGGQNYCFIYSYDLNGNRLGLNNLTYGAAGTWGSSIYGCFNWTPS